MKKGPAPRSFSEVGFTLIEILVVVTIIVLMTAVAAVSYSQFLKQSRDTRRKADIEQIRAALEMYRSNNDTYPTTGLSELTTPTVYIQSVPADPKTLVNYPYTLSSCNGTPTICNDYTLSANLESGGTYTVGPYGAATSTPTPLPTNPPPP